MMHSAIDRTHGRGRNKWATAASRAADVKRVKRLPDFCALEDQIDKVSDSVTVGIEIRNNDLPPSKTLHL